MFYYSMININKCLKCQLSLKVRYSLSITRSELVTNAKTRLKAVLTYDKTMQHCLNFNVKENIHVEIFINYLKLIM